MQKDPVRISYFLLQYKVSELGFYPQGPVRILDCSDYYVQDPWELGELGPVGFTMCVIRTSRNPALHTVWRDKGPVGITLKDKGLSESYLPWQGGGGLGGAADKKWNVLIRAHPLSGNFKLAPGHYLRKYSKWIVKRVIISPILKYMLSLIKHLKEHVF